MEEQSPSLLYHREVHLRLAVLKSHLTCLCCDSGGGIKASSLPRKMKKRIATEYSQRLRSYQWTPHELVLLEKAGKE